MGNIDWREAFIHFDPVFGVGFLGLTGTHSSMYINED